MRKVIIYAVLAVFLLTGCSSGTDYVSEGTAYLQEHQYEETVSSFEEAIRISEEASASSGNTGGSSEEASGSSGDTGGSARKEKAEKIDVAEAYRGLGMACYELQDYEKARDAFQQVLNHDGKATAVLYNFIGVCSMHLNDPKGALDAFGEGIKLAGDTAGAEETDDAEVIREMKFNEVVCYEKLLDWENAKTKIQEYVSEYPDDQDAQKEAAFLSTR